MAGGRQLGRAVVSGEIQSWPDPPRWGMEGARERKQNFSTISPHLSGEDAIFCTPLSVSHYQAVMGTPTWRAVQGFLTRLFPSAKGLVLEKTASCGNQDIQNCVDGKHRFPKSVVIMEIMNTATSTSWSHVFSSQGYSTYDSISLKSQLHPGIVSHPHRVSHSSWSFRCFVKRLFHYSMRLATSEWCAKGNISDPVITSPLPHLLCHKVSLWSKQMICVIPCQ